MKQVREWWNKKWEWRKLETPPLTFMESPYSGKPSVSSRGDGVLIRGREGAAANICNLKMELDEIWTGGHIWNWIWYFIFYIPARLPQANPKLGASLSYLLLRPPGTLEITPHPPKKKKKKVLKKIIFSNKSSYLLFLFNVHLFRVKQK